MKITEGVFCLCLPLWQSVLSSLVVSSEEGGKSLLFVFERSLLCAELFEEWYLHLYWCETQVVW